MPVCGTEYSAWQFQFADHYYIRKLLLELPNKILCTVPINFFKGFTCNLWTMEAVEAVSSRTFGTLLLNCLAALSAMTSEAARRRERKQLVNWLQNFENFD